MRVNGLRELLMHLAGLPEVDQVIFETKREGIAVFAHPRGDPVARPLLGTLRLDQPDIYGVTLRTTETDLARGFLSGIDRSARATDASTLVIAPTARTRGILAAEAQRFDLSYIGRVGDYCLGWQRDLRQTHK